MNKNLFPDPLRNFILRHQAAVTGAVFVALLAVWCSTVWGLPGQDAEASPAVFADPQVPLTPKDSATILKARNDSMALLRSKPGWAADSAASARMEEARRRQAAVTEAVPDTVRRFMWTDSSYHVISDSAYSALPDSLRSFYALRDTSKRNAVVVPRDSTARIEQFHYKRPVTFTALPTPQRGYSMFLRQPSLIQTEVKLDSTGQFVIIRETLGGKDTKIPVKMPLKEYIAERFTSGNTKNFEDLVLKSTEIKKRDDLGELLTSFTNIDIPIPANPVFSIFGPPRINLHISGAVDIRAAFRNTTTDQVTTSALGNSRNEPDFAQEVQINVSGTIGDKLNILADWNTQRQFEYENQLKIKYTGYEDEIVQSVEAGNVSLPTNSRFISSSSALFGIKAVFQLGPLKLTAVASQKKGQVQEKTVTGGSSEVPFEKKAYEYSKDHFFINAEYIKYYETYVRKREANYATQIKDYEVWITNQSLDLTNTRKGVAYLDLPAYQASSLIDSLQSRRSVDASVPGSIEDGTWVKLTKDTDYKIDEFAGYITLNRSTENVAVAIAYRIENNNPSGDDDLYFGSLSNLDTASVLVLKLIKPKSLLPQYKVPWKMMMKNFYPLGGRKIQKAGFTLDILYKPNTGETTPKIGATNILELFGLDNYSEAGDPNPDGKFDFTEGTTIDSERGEIIFPSLEPFRTGLIESFAKYKVDKDVNDYIYGDVYDTTVFAAQNNTPKDRFIISGKTTAGSSNTVNLGFNIVENSVIVTLDGQNLTPNVDYTVDYIIGQVIIKNQAALVPGANLQVKFEQNDLFQLASKTLLGLRGDLNLSERTQFGFTMMNLDQQTLSDKVRLGEEPMNNSIYGIDGKTGADLAFLTKAIDWLPFIDTKAKSDVSVFGEAAYMSPDPNTKKSPIPIDKGKSIAYVDDFEGAKRTIPLGVGYGLWHDISAPAFMENMNVMVDGKPRQRDEEAKSWYKGRSFWFNQLPSDVTIFEIYGDKKKVASGQQYLTVMNLNYNPRKRGQYNYSPTLSNNFGAGAPSDSLRKNWSGVQRVLSSSALDLVRENINFIELWVKVQKGKVDSTRKIYIDLGAISEDVIPNRVMDTEDQGTFKNTILNEGEDTGIDGFTDDGERIDKAAFVTANVGAFPELAGDPAGDNWAFSSGARDYERVNGTDNNKESEIGRFPDTEDLNRNNVIDRTNSYFEYQLNLDTNATNPQRVGGGLNGWYQYRIPLIDFTSKIGVPDFSLIEYVRLWMTGFDDEVELRLFDFNLVGNQWEELKKNDSTFVVSTINVEDNLNYIIPPGVVREKDKSQPDQDVIANEQALQFKVTGLKDGESRHAIKRFTYKSLDVFNYKELKMFVHGDPNFTSDPKKPSAKLVVRFGRDSMNYYEYRAPLIRGDSIPSVPTAGTAAYIDAQTRIWRPENNVDIIFSDLTKLKQGRDSLSMFKRVSGPVPNGPDSSEYAIVGNPDLTRVAFISVGVENPDIRGTEPMLTGEVWINELRLADVDNTPGWAYSVSASLKIADLASVGFTYSKQDPYFHQLETAFGSRTTSVNWNLTASISLEKFLPTSWAGTSFPFSYSHSEGLSSPLYLPASDVLVEKAAEQQRTLLLERGANSEDAEYESKKLIFESQTTTITDSYSLPSFKVNIPVDAWYVRDIINKMQFGFTYSTAFSRSPQREYSKAWNWAGSFGYAYTFEPDLFVEPFDIFTDVPVLNGLRELKLFFPITNFSLKLAASRAQTRERIRNQRENPLIRSLVASRGLAFGWKLTEGGLLNLSGDYSVDIGSTLVHLETNETGAQRGFLTIVDKLVMRDQLIGFGIDNAYQQNLSINTRPRLPDLFNINKFASLTFRYGVGYSWSNNTQLGELGKATRWSSNISMSSDVSLKQFVESWWPKETESVDTPAGMPQQGKAPSRRRNRDDEDGEEDLKRAAAAKADSLGAQDSTLVVTDTLDTSGGMSEKIAMIARMAIKTPFLDFEKISISLTQTNSSSNTGVAGRPGFANFFGRIPFFQKGISSYGPTWAYQMGFVSDPTANITDIKLIPKFPFVGFLSNDELEARAQSMPLNSTLPEAFSQSNKLTFKTNRDLWEGARIDVNWNVGWDYSRTRNIRIDVERTIIGADTILVMMPDGVTVKHFATISGLVTGGSVERSFFTMPFLKSTINEVSDQYKKIKGENPKKAEDQLLSESFEKGFESLPFLRKLFGQFMPRMNYSLRWDGLEKYSVFTDWATRVSLDHSYQSTYRRSFKGNPSGIEVTESQRVSYGFAPLIGLSLTFKELLKGNMSANLRYSSSETYDLQPSSKNIAESGTREISFTASYGRSGFEIPFFGLALNNDIDISLSYSYAKSSRKTYALTSEGLNAAGTPGEGSSRTTMEPRIKYVLSSRVTASLFYRYTKIAPDEGGSRIPGSSTNEGGLDVHIAIQ